MQEKSLLIILLCLGNIRNESKKYFSEIGKVHTVSLVNLTLKKFEIYIFDDL